MASSNDGEDFFDDDDLDALPQDALLELENNAIQFTQAQTQAQFKHHPSSDYGDDFEDDDLDDAVVIDESRSTPALAQSLDQNLPRRATEREQFRQQRYRTVSNAGPNVPSRQRQDIPPPPIFSQSNRNQDQITVAQNGFVEQKPNQLLDDEVVEKLRKYDELLKERNSLRDEVNAKTGEISIVRSKHDNTVKDFEQKLNALRKLNDDKLAKQQKALEAARIAEKNATTERDFIKQDLAEESERVRRLNKARETERKDGPSLMTTPKKKKAFPHRDGFDDDEIEMLSPSKLSPSKFQRRVSSPSKPGKRKRKTVDSPVGALQVIRPEEATANESAQNAMTLDENIIAKLAIEDDRFDFLGVMLDHRVNADHLRTIEELGKHFLPSSPSESLQAFLLGKIPALGLKKTPKDLPIDFCELLISLWSLCIEKEYLSPVYLLIDMLAFALEMKTSSVAPHIIDSLLPTAQLTADIVAIPRFNRNSTAPHDKHIDVSVCMSILHLAALGCMSNQQHITRFWKLMRWDFVLMMLSTNQVKADYETMLSLLSTSVMRDTVGTIPGDHTQDLQTGYILDRLTYPLNEVPFLPMSTEKCDVATISDLRLQILHLMTSMTRSPYASKAIATHTHAIGRLVCLMSDELDALYDFKTSHKQSAQIIGLSIRLLYHLITKYDEIVDMQKKLAVIHGGTQKYLLCLSRLNFSEDDLVLESGIDPDIPAYALELLELIVTPEEGDAIQLAFSNS